MPSPARSTTAQASRVVPALSGLGAPWWRPDALASIEGIGPGTEPAHVVRSTVEGLAAQVTLLARAAAIDLGRPLALLRVDGGLTRSRVLMQMQADLLQVPVEVAASPHATAAGVGALARLGAGAGRTLDDVVRWDEPDARYEPVMGPDEAGERLARFERAVARLDSDPCLHVAMTEERRYDVAVIGARGGRHRHRSPAGPLPIAHRAARARQRRRHRHLEGQHGHCAHRLRHATRKPGVVAGPPRPRAADLVRAGGGHRPRGDRCRPGGLERGAGGPARRRAGQGPGQRLRPGRPAGRSAELARREPHLARGAAGAVAIPDESIICPWSPSIAFATEAVGAGVGAPPRHGGHRCGARRFEAGCCTPREDRSGPTGWSTRPGLGADLLNRRFGHDEFTIAPRRGQLIVFDKLSRGLVSSIVLPVPTERTKGVLVAPTVYGNVLLGPTAEDIEGRDDTVTTAPGLDGLLDAGRRILPDLVRRGGHRDLRGHTGRDRTPRLPDHRSRGGALRLRRGDPLHRTDRITGDRRVRRRATWELRA